ncbi:hypothetical protein [Deinococcus radiophilus]
MNGFRLSFGLGSHFGALSGKAGAGADFGLGGFSLSVAGLLAAGAALGRP